MKYFYSASRFGSGGFSSFFILQGALLILLGVLIVMFPELLRIMVATFFIGIGVLVLGFGMTLRKVHRGVSDQQDRFIDV